MDKYVSTRGLRSLVGLSGPAITKLIKARKFPAPTRIGSAFAHDRDAVLAWLSTRPRVRRGSRLEYRHRDVDMPTPARQAGAG